MTDRGPHKIERIIDCAMEPTSGGAANDGRALSPRGEEADG